MAKQALVIEDDATTAKRHVMLLESLGYAVRTATDGIAAMNSLRDHPTTELALVDWYMQPLNGYAFAAAIRAERRYQDLMMIMVTSEDRPEKISQALQAGVDAHLVKPLRPNALLQAIEQVESEKGQKSQKVQTLPPAGVSIDPISGRREQVGQYKVGRLLGQGASSRVYLGTHLTTGKEAAIKVLYSHAMDERSLRRFRKEASLLSSMNHPHLLKVFESGTIDDAEFLIIEYAQEGDAIALLKKHSGRLPERIANPLIAQCAQALGVVHDMGAAHRDIKPSNIFIGADCTAKLGDFGLALTNLNHTRITGSGMTVGTPSYMAPEQVRGSRESAQRSDIYGLGATWFHFLTGRPPFDEATAYSTFLAIERDPVPTPESFGIELRPQTKRLLMQSLSKDEKLRPKNPHELAEGIIAIG